MSRETTISGQMHDVAQAGWGLAVVALTLRWGWAWWLAALLASPGLALVKLVKHRLTYREATWLSHLKDGAWEAMIFAGGWVVFLRQWWLAIPLALGWWAFLSWFRRRTLWGNP